MKSLSFKVLLSAYLLLATAFSAFDTPDIDARAKAMGSAITAKPVSGSAIIFNPSHLAIFDKMMATVTVFPRSRGLENGSIIQASGNFVLPIKKVGGLGLSFNSLFVTLNGSALYNEYEVALGYGRAIGSSFQLGATVLLQMLDVDDSANADFSPTVNFTTGITYNISESWALALVGQNLVGMNLASKGSSEKDAVPRNLKFGGAFSRPAFLIALDMNFKFVINEFSYRLGMEYYISNKRFVIGLGCEFIDLIRGINPSIGFGMNIGIFTVHYAFSYPILSRSGAGDHLLSLALRF